MFETKTPDIPFPPKNNWYYSQRVLFAIRNWRIYPQLYVYDMVWWYDLMLCDMIYAMVWYVVICYMIWCGMVWHDIMIWYDTVRYDMLWYDIFVKLQLSSHPVAVVQYTFTHKQYTEQHKTNNIYNNTKMFFWKSAGRAPSLRVIPWHLPYKWGKSTESLRQGSRRVPAGTMKIYMLPWFTSLDFVYMLKSFRNIYTIGTVIKQGVAFVNIWYWMINFWYTVFPLIYKINSIF